MCGIAAIFGRSWSVEELKSMIASQRHRGPDGDGIYFSPKGTSGLGHNRLKIIDLTVAGKQPMLSRDGNRVISYNGEIYNYLELRRELESDYEFRTRTDTEVLLAAYSKWGEKCLDKLIGMFAFVVWDEKSQTAFAARDRFGVKPLYYHEKSDGTLIIASEIKAIHAAGVPRIANQKTWATYLTYGLYDHSESTFWSGIQSLPGGHYIKWSDNRTTTYIWYDLSQRADQVFDDRPASDVKSEYFQLMKESVEFRFRSDVPVGINLSGGLDSSCLLGMVHEVQGSESDVKAFTFTTGNENYDELSWVRQMLDTTNHPLVVSQLTPGEVPSLARDVQAFQDEPFGGLPTLAYAKLFNAAKENGVKVLLDGNGMDEQWAGYDYYQIAFNGHAPSLVQGISDSPVRPECLTRDFRDLAEPPKFPTIFGDKLRNIQYRDARFTKIPRAMRFNDRISMQHSTELREPFLDHRLFELALRQPPERKIRNGTGKAMLRQISNQLVPNDISGAPKRSIQTPQREWLRVELREWVIDNVESSIEKYAGTWMDANSTRSELYEFLNGKGDNSFFIWQWITLSVMLDRRDSAITAAI